MPTYQFHCTNDRCAKSNDFESRVVPIAERDAQSCDICGDRMERLPAAPNFKVEGFNARNGYANDK